MCGGLEHGSLWYESDDFAPSDLDAARGGLGLHRFERTPDGRRVGVGEVHRDLRLPVHLEAESFHAGKAAAGEPDLLGDLLGDGEVQGRTEVDVVCDEERAGANDGRARGRVHVVGAEVGNAVGIDADFVAGFLEFAAPNVGEVRAVGSRRRAFIQKHGNAKFGSYACAERFREGDALIHRGVAERDEGADVGSANARVLACVRGQVE